MTIIRVLIIVGEILLAVVLLFGTAVIAGLFLYLAMLAGMAGGG